MAELRFFPGIKDGVPGCEHDACRIENDLLLLVLPFYRSRTTDIIAEPALDAVLLVLDNDIRDCLGMRFVDRLPDADARIETVVDFYRADKDAVPATGAGRFINVPRVFFTVTRKWPTSPSIFSTSEHVWMVMPG